MDATLGLLRRLRGLKKFHLLVERHMAKTLYWHVSQWRKSSPSTIHGVAKLFSMRGLSDIKVRDLVMEDRVRGAGVYATSASPDKAGLESQAQVLEHFNHGLALAQHGVVVHELYKDHTWMYDTYWPKLGDAVCGTSIGCSCGGSGENAGDEEKSDE